MVPSSLPPPLRLIPPPPWSSIHPQAVPPLAPPPHTSPPPCPPPPHQSSPHTQAGGCNLGQEKGDERACGHVGAVTEDLLQVHVAILDLRGAGWGGGGGKGMGGQCMKKGVLDLRGQGGQVGHD